MKRIWVLLLATFLVPSFVMAEDSAQSEKKMDALLVYGDGFMFSVKEPTGWVGDTKNSSKYSANIIFYPASQSFETAQTIIRVLIADKTDENIQADLASDMKQYKEQYAGVKFKSLAVTHPTYRTFPKLFTVPGSFYEYVTYVNPGPQKKLMFSVSMNKQKSEATSDDLVVYQKIISSLLLL